MNVRVGTALEERTKIINITFSSRSANQVFGKELSSWEKSVAMPTAALRVAAVIIFVLFIFCGVENQKKVFRI